MAKTKSARKYLKSNMKIISHTTLSVLLITFLLVSTAKAEYNSALGIRVGKFAVGPNFKWFFDETANTGLDLYAGYTREAGSGYFVRGFLMQQLPILDPKMHIPMDIVYGVGPHMAYFSDNYYRINNGDALYYNSKTLSAGLSLMFGFEWDSERVPFTLGVDVIPYYSVYNPGPEWIDMSVSVRYKFR
jgi:hypothetical protein